MEASFFSCRAADISDSFSWAAFCAGCAVFSCSAASFWFCSACASVLFASSSLFDASSAFYCAASAAEDVSASALDASDIACTFCAAVSEAFVSSSVFCFVSAARRPLRQLDSEPPVTPCDCAFCVETDCIRCYCYAFLKTLFEFAISRSLENGPL